jgi:CarboxypepD_reg-like domain
MKINLFLLVVCCLLCATTAVFGQKIEGQVVESGHNKPIAFVNVGIFKKNRGTVTNERGRFQLDVSGLAETDTLRFSIIGFAPRDLSIQTVRELCATNCNIELTAKNYDLKEAVIISKKYKMRTVGNDISNKRISAGSVSDSLLGHEFGVLIEIKKRPAVVDEIILHINKCTFDTVFLRLNIFKTADKKPTENLMPQPVYVHFTSAEAKAGPVRIDVSKYGVEVFDDFLVSFEIVKNLGAGELTLSAGLLKDRTFFRRTSQAEWETSKMLGISIAARIYQE